MASMDYWATAPMARDQATLLAPTLDSMIPEGSQVRVLDEILAGANWAEWEAEYDGKRGQPPIHPRWVAACILYGLMRGIRSSRKLEYQCSCNVEFMWLLEGRQIDHSTIAKFRTRFAKQLKGLFRHVCRMAMSIGLIRLGEVAFDGTREELKGTLEIGGTGDKNGGKNNARQLWWWVLNFAVCIGFLMLWSRRRRRAQP